MCFCCVTKHLCLFYSIPQNWTDDNFTIHTNSIVRRSNDFESMNTICSKMRNANQEIKKLQENLHPQFVLDLPVFS